MLLKFIDAASFLLFGIGSLKQKCWTLTRNITNETQAMEQFRTGVIGLVGPDSKTG
jgi:hypothetical protein